MTGSLRIGSSGQSLLVHELHELLLSEEVPAVI
jgi:hypothetical protein